MIPVDVASIGETLVSARSQAEHSAMFSLTDDDLGNRVLDCPGGAASFTAEALSRGVDVTAVDPAYAGGRRRRPLWPTTLATKPAAATSTC